MIKMKMNFVERLVISSLIIVMFTGLSLNPVGTKVGDVAPQLMLEDADNLCRQSESDYVLVSFWASYNAESRINNALMDYACSTSDNVEMVSVSVDENKSVYETSIEIDDIKTSQRYWLQGKQKSRIQKVFNLTKGFSNYLINKEGVIVARNITPEELTLLIGQQD